jgi:hypothetical protein
MQKQTYYTTKITVLIKGSRNVMRPLTWYESVKGIGMAHAAIQARRKYPQAIRVRVIAPE